MKKISQETHIPTYIRPPLNGGRCPHCGLTRSAIYELIMPSPENGYHPPVSSRVLKKHKGAERGIRLVHFKSLMDYLDQLPA